jgi:hypothetical protein
MLLSKPNQSMAKCVTDVPICFLGYKYRAPLTLLCWRCVRLAMHSSTRYIAFAVVAVLFLLLLYRWSLILPQTKVLFSISFIALPTFLGMFLGFKLLRGKEVSTGSTVLCIFGLALSLPFLSSLMMYSIGLPNPLGSLYTPQLIMIVMIAISCLAIVLVRPIRDFLTGLTTSKDRSYVRSIGSPHRFGAGDHNATFLSSRLGFGRFAVLGGVSVLGIPRGFPSPGSKLTQDVEGILSSKEDLGSYSTGFLTSLSKLKEHLVFEIQVSRKRVSLYLYTLILSRNLREAAKRASSATQAVRGAITGAYGKNVNANTLSRAELTSALNTILGGEPTTYHIGLLKKEEAKT